MFVPRPSIASAACVFAPAAVFWVNPVKMIRGMESDKTKPGTFGLIAKYRDKCTACNKCVEVCPLNALSLTMPEEVRA